MNSIIKDQEARRRAAQNRAVIQNLARELDYHVYFAEDSEDSAVTPYQTACHSVRETAAEIKIKVMENAMDILLDHLDLELEFQTERFVIKKKETD